MRNERRRASIRTRKGCGGRGTEMESCRVLWVLCSLCSRASSRGRWRWDCRRSAHSAAGVGGAEKVVVVHKTSRLDFVKMNQPDKTEHDIARIVS